VTIPQLNAHQQYLIEEFVEDYREHRMARRDLLRRVLLITGSIPASASLLATLGCGTSGGGDKTPAAGAATNAAGASPPPASAAAVSPTVIATPAAGSTRDVRFAGPAGELLGYLAVPAGLPGAKFPGIVVIHENRGLVEHTRDVARRFANEGFVALAVDLVSRDGGSKADEALNTGFLGRANPDDLAADLVASVKYVGTLASVRAGGVGVVGYCFGGGYTFEVAIASPDVKAAVPYYGTVRKLDDLGKTNAAILAIYGGDDTRVTAQSEQVRQRLAAAGKTFEIKVYPGANHAFFNDTGPRYNETAAKDAWALTLAWFRKYLPTA
jgi:carboxymethylenebutenolidase